MLIKGDLIPLDTGVLFPASDLKPVTAKRFLHDGTNYLSLDLSDNLNPRLFYYLTDGTSTASYVMQQDYIFDISYSDSLNTFFTARASVSGTSINGIIVEEVNAFGQVQDTVINRLNIISGTTFNFNTIKPNVELVVSDFDQGYIRVDRDIYDLPFNGSSFTTTSGYDETDANITKSTDIVKSGAFNLLYSRNDDEYLGTFHYEPLINEFIFSTLAVTSGSSPINNNRDLFLSPPTNQSRVDMNNPSEFTYFLNHLDPNTLYVNAISGSRVFLSFWNIDSDSTAFTSINLEDVSLRAGTGANSTVKAEVTNAWGEPLQNKNVTFTLAQGDGVLSPLISGTNVSGVANSVYTTGTLAGLVEIQIEVED